MATQTEPRLPLNRDRILQAALELADEAGIESLTMRKLGQTLGFEAMSLYNYVASKDDLLDGMLDRVLDETEPPSPAGDWATAIRRSAISVHKGLTDHPWACPLLMSPGHIRPARLQYMDSLLGRLREAGFSAGTTYHAYHVLDAHIFGFSLWQANHSYNAVQISSMVTEFERLIPVDLYPYLHEHGEQHFEEGPHRGVSAFAFALDFVLDGLEKIRVNEQTA
jgi:AcrR family transcriptional regulator